MLVGREITERKRHETHLEYMACHDPLTGIPNRRLFEDRLDRLVKESKRDQQPFAVMFLDVDDFKHVNDSLGHDAGDEFLKQVILRLQKCLRESDTLARFGGDELMILCNIQHEQDVIQIAERIRSSLRMPFHYQGECFGVTVSIGIAVFPQAGQTVYELMKQADDALYEGKKEGKGVVIIRS